MASCSMTRREAIHVAAGVAALTALSPSVVDAEPRSGRVPVIDVTDLYHPPQDPGDNFDLVAAYALPEVDLRAVILDVTQRYRQKVGVAPDPAYTDPTGPRDPGFIPVCQLNYIFNRNVPCATGPFEQMRSPDDPMRDAPGFQQQGVELLLRTLRESRDPVEIVSFGSARPVAVAYNRDPGLMRRKVRMIHLSAGACPSGYLEWNVMLDRHAFVRVLRSDLPVAIYPCATDHGPFDYGQHNTYWLLPDLQLIRRMDPRLRSYLCFAFERTQRVDFLRAVEEAPDPAALDRVCARQHNVWETAVWSRVARRALVSVPGGGYRLLPAGGTSNAGDALPNELVPCRVGVRDDGQLTYEPDRNARKWMYDRGDARRNEAALRQALPELYTGFHP